MFTTIRSLISQIFSSEKKAETVVVETTPVAIIPEVPETPAPTAPYESATMKMIISVLVQKGLAVVSHGKSYGDANIYYHSMHEAENVISSFVETTETAPVMRGIEYEQAYKAIISQLGSDLKDVVSFCEDHGANRNCLEHAIHKMIVQVAIAYATYLNKELRGILRVKGSFGLVGRIYSPLVIDGDVDTIEGNVAPYLRITGNVRNLGVGPFWAENPVTGESGLLVIKGDLKGYKTSINNPDLEIEIGGNVTTKSAFLYRTNIFRKMTIHGDVLTETAICPGFYQGTLVIKGEAPYLADYLRPGGSYQTNTSAGNNAWMQFNDAGHIGSSLFLGDIQLLDRGMTGHMKQKASGLLHNRWKQ